MVMLKSASVISFPVTNRESGDDSLPIANLGIAN